MAKDQIPNPTFIKVMDKFYAKKYSKQIEQELKERPDLVERLSLRQKQFLIWAGEMRLIFKPDLDIEVDEFLQLRIRANSLSVLNIKAWIRLRKVVFDRDNYTCTYCGNKSEKLECDHIIPISKGGLDDIENLTTSCLRCNRQKKDKTVEQFKEWRTNR